MRKFGLILAGAVGLATSLLSGQAYALVCVGPITPVMPNATLPDTALGGGACFSAGDKTFGNFSISNNVPPGFVRFGFGPGTAIPHSLLFINGLLPAGATITTQFEVRDDLAGTSISGLTEDFVLNGGSAGIHADVTIVGGANAGPFPPGLTCSRGFPAPTCPATLLFPAGTTDVVIVDTLTTSADFSGNAIINMISQTAVPEPSSLMLLARRSPDWAGSAAATRPRKERVDSGPTSGYCFMEILIFVALSTILLPKPKYRSLLR